MRKLGFCTTLLAGCLMLSPALAVDFKIGLGEDPDVLDPAQSRTFVGRIVYTAMCDKLFDVSPDLKIVPMLATSYAWSDDGKTLTLQIRPNVKFHDGTPLDAEAVAFTIKRNLTLPESRRKSELASVADAVATGPLEVKLTLKAPDATLVAQLSDRAGMIVSPTAAKALGANFGSHPVCAGPYEFVERVQQDRIVLKKFADYWDKASYPIDKVTYVPIVDTTVRLANLRAGDLDLIERAAPTDVETIKADPKLNFFQAIGAHYVGLYVNVANGDKANNPLAKDKRIRQAFSLAIDRDAISQIVFDGTAVPGNQPYPPSSQWFNKAIPVPARDVEKAKSLLKAAGVERVTVTAQTSNDPINAQMMQMIQSMVAEAGFDMSIRTMEFATLLSQQSAGNFQINEQEWSGRVDPDGNLHQFVTCGAGLNDMKYCNKDVDQLLNDARHTVDPAVRKAKYDAADLILDDEAPIIYLAHRAWLYGASKKVTGFAASPDGMIRLKGVTKSN